MLRRDISEHLSLALVRLLLLVASGHVSDRLGREGEYEDYVREMWHFYSSPERRSELTLEELDDPSLRYAMWLIKHW